MTSMDVRTVTPLQWEIGTFVCPARLGGHPEGLPCGRHEPHEHGHVFVNSSGSNVDDRHREGGHG